MEAAEKIEDTQNMVSMPFPTTKTACDGGDSCKGLGEFMRNRKKRHLTSESSCDSELDSSLSMSMVDGCRALPPEVCS